MKRFTLMLLVLASATVYAQKAPKPNLNKALASLKEGKYEEAKTNIDAAITNEKLKEDGKTWYYRGLIYMAMDTTSNEQVRALAPDAFKVAMESFAEADKRADGKKEYFIQDAVTALPQTKTQQVAFWANAHVNKGAKMWQEEDFASALTSFEKASEINPNDTVAFLYGGIAAMQAENWDREIANLNKYIEKGGTSPDAYVYLYNVYNGPKEDKEKALEVVREALKKFPNHPDFPKLEIGMLIDLKRIDEAKAGLEEAIKKEPDNKILHFYLGYANAQMNNLDVAKKNYEDALKIDPQYFEAAFYLARLVHFDAIDIKKQMGQLGITAADKKKRFELDNVLVQKLKIALPYWERAEKINPNDQEVLDNLYTIYGDLDMQDQVKRIEKKYKELGYEN